MANILIIDDEDAIRGMVRILLERRGHAILEAADGELGIAAFRANSIDLVITDAIMPNKDGLETIAEIRKEDPEVKIIIISGGGHRLAVDILAQAKELGADMAVKKPFSPGELTETVESLLKTA